MWRSAPSPDGSGIELSQLGRRCQLPAASFVAEQYSLWMLGVLPLAGIGSTLAKSTPRLTGGVLPLKTSVTMSDDLLERLKVRAGEVASSVSALLVRGAELVLGGGLASTDEALSTAIARAEVAERRVAELERKLASLAEPSSVVPLRRPPSKSRAAESGVIPALGDEARRTAVSKLNLPVYDPGRNLILDPVDPKKGK